MFARIFSAFTSRRLVQPSPSRPAHAAEAHAFLSRVIAEPAPVRPPSADNANPLAALYEPIERELKQAGYLR